MNYNLFELFLPSLLLGEILDIELGTEGDGTGREEIGGQASSQHEMPLAGVHHNNPLFFMYKRKTRRMTPRPAIAPNIVPPSKKETHKKY